MSKKDFSLSEFAGYSLSPLREDAPFTLYRGRRHDNPLPVLVVALTAEQPSQEAVRRLEREYSLASKLDATWSARPLELTRWEGRPVLILADPGGEPLDLILEKRKGEELNLTRSLRIAAGLARAVSQVHRQGLIHKDINPKNILVNEAGDVWLTGFGIASQLSNERHASSPPEIIAGTLAYMAPEQTGRMNRSIDARSDLYSLGVTLYRMLTGHLPFAARDAMEWVHCHIAREPAPPHSICDLPVPLSYVVMRLLAKTAEDRYQTAAGLETDLLHCLTQWEMHGRIDSFELRTCDVADRLLIPEKLYGRENELGTLEAAFSRVVASGSPELVLVSGYAGVGKSSLVNELQKVLIAQRGLFAVGKFDQYKRDIPYATVVQAFHGLVRQFLVKGKEEVDHLRSVLSEALGSNGQLLIDLIPEIEFIIGEQSPASELPPKQSKNRFQLMLRRLLGAFATREHPLVLFLDDLQWQDAATLEFLEHLLTHSEVRHLLLIGAYRDNEIDSSPQLSRTIQAIRGTDAKVVEIVLSPLEIGHIDLLVSDALHCTPSSAYPLAQLIREKTSGNPFFAIQFFTSLTDEGLLSLDQVTRTWQWNMDRIRAKEYSDNVVDLMSGKIGRLSAGTQDMLKELACLGSVVQLAILALARGESEKAMETSLNEAVRAGLIFSEERRYRFLHDRIQQAAYSLVPDERRAEVHLRIGRTLLSGLKENQLSEHLFDVATQLNRGAKGLTQRDEKIRVASINLRAGRKASAAAAYASARAYFSAGVELLDEEDWAAHYEPMFSLWLECARAELLSGNFEECKQLTEKLLPRATSKVDQAAVYQLKIQSHTLKSENDQAVAAAIDCLRSLGIDLPVHPSGEMLQAEHDGVLQSLAGRLPESLIDQPLIIDQDMQAAMEVLSSLIPAAFKIDFRLWCVLVSRMVKIGIQHGTSGAAAHAYCNWGCVLGHVFNNYPEGDRFCKLACDLIEKYNFIAHRAEVYYSMGSLALFRHPVATAIGYFRTTVREGIETGNLGFACYGKYQIMSALLLRNDPLDDVWRESEAALHFVREARYDDIFNIIDCQLRFVAAMQGKTADLFAHSDAHFDEAKFEPELSGGELPFIICWYWILKLKARFLLGDFAEALDAAEKAQLLLSASACHIQLLDYFFYYGLAVAACYKDVSDDQQQTWRLLLAVHVEQLRLWAEMNPSTFVDKYALLSAEIARLEGRDADAMGLYEQAIRSAREHGFVQNEGLAHALAASYYSTHGVASVARAYLRNARNCYERWGAVAKVKQLDGLYSDLQEERVSLSGLSTIGAPVGQLDFETVIKASQALSSEMVLPRLVEKLMQCAVELAGAEKGLLVLLRRGEPQIEAEATIRHGGVQVTVRQTAVTPLDLPKSVLQYVVRTRERVVIDDASIRNMYSEDEYMEKNHLRSVLCVPIVKQSKFTGALYLENNLTPGAFTSARVAVLELLASQAAISLENAIFYSDLQRSETLLAQAQSISHTGSFSWNVDSGEAVYSEETFNIFELDRTVKPSFEVVSKQIHPDDLDTVQKVIQRATSNKTDYEVEHRLKMPDGSVKHVHTVARALTTSSGSLEYVGALTDITERKRAADDLRKAFDEIRKLKDQLYHENIALREEISNASMFEEIVGTSPLLQGVLDRISKVAPTDSSVLITGETGTGKELFAHAIHNRSKRASRVFVSVNCAAVPHDLIPSELFGHEKGAFTGATQRRLGRFELADGGTIFLDEVGELPLDTQIALLRVLQEREFERVGGTGPIRTNVRVIAATNRNLEAAIASGSFRRDLFYRLNVFPIEVPSLRERRGDLPLLVEYFLDRYARKAGKNFKAVNEKSLELLQSYSWPGNIRELQNVIERSVIVCDLETFSVDESWISTSPVANDPSKSASSNERETIEEALSECGGRVYGPFGAAGKLGIPRTTLESRIKALKINKNRFKV